MSFKFEKLARSSQALGIFQALLEPSISNIFSTEPWKMLAGLIENSALLDKGIGLIYLEIYLEA